MLEFRKDCLRSERETIIAFPGEASDARPEVLLRPEEILLYDSIPFLTVPETLPRGPTPTQHIMRMAM